MFVAAKETRQLLADCFRSWITVASEQTLGCIRTYHRCFISIGSPGIFSQIIPKSCLDVSSGLQKPGGIVLRNRSKQPKKVPTQRSGNKEKTQHECPCHAVHFVCFGFIHFSALFWLSMCRHIATLRLEKRCDRTIHVGSTRLKYPLFFNFTQLLLDCTTYTALCTTTKGQ